MPKHSLDGALQRLFSVAAVQTYRGLSDGELLDRFLGSNDESAFTVLIERHGPMVLGVCRRALPNRHDAEDACQATFLVLARKADSLRKKESLGSWLHGVARRVTANLKRDAVRRKKRERRIDPPTPTSAASEVTWREVQGILDEELLRLPERYRAPLILCYLESQTRDEAARRLGISAGSLHGRLERARSLLRDRLTERGLTLSGVMLATALGDSASTGSLPPTLVVSSVKAATLLAAGEALTDSVIGTNVIALFQEVLKSMFLARMKLGTAAVLCAALVALIGGSLTSLGFAQDANPKQPVGEKGVSFTKPESDKDFICRTSKDLRGTDPTPAEVHFFVASKESGKRQKLIDLFIQERQAKKDAQRVELLIELERAVRADWLARDLQDQFQKTAKVETLQEEFFKKLHAVKDKEEVAKITQAYLDRLIQFIKNNPTSPDLPAAIKSIAVLYEAQGKNVEARAWRDKLPKENTKGASGSGPPAGKH